MGKIKEDVRGATIVITGASSGFGRGTALKLAEKGANVVLAARRTHVLGQLESEIKADGGTALAVTTDVSKPEQVQRLADAAVERFGGIDVWINNVGIGALGLFWEIPLDVHARIVDVNLNGLIYGAHTALRQFLLQGHGVLVNIGSIDSEVPIAYQTSYASTKAAVLSITRSLNEELHLVGADENIKVGTIMPWAVDTPWWNHAANYTGHAPRMASMDDPSTIIDAIVQACVHPQETQPVGWKARASNVSHQIFPDLSERMTASIADDEVEKAMPLAPTNGTVFEPNDIPGMVEGGIRARMEKEDK